jgi:hypothetical protein
MSLTRFKEYYWSVSFSPNTFFVLNENTFFFRIEGRGLHFEKNKELSFSERMGLKPYWRFGDWILTTLK